MEFLGAPGDGHPTGERLEAHPEISLTIVLTMYILGNCNSFVLKAPKRRKGRSMDWKKVLQICFSFTLDRVSLGSRAVSIYKLLYWVKLPAEHVTIAPSSSPLKFMVFDLTPSNILWQQDLVKLAKLWTPRIHTLPMNDQAFLGINMFLSRKTASSFKHFNYPGILSIMGFFSTFSSLFSRNIHHSWLLHFFAPQYHRVDVG